MTVIVRRSDCQCGGLTGLFFGRAELSRVTAPEEAGGSPGYITEIHYPTSAYIDCTFYFNGQQITPGRASVMILNTAAARPERAAKLVGP